MDARWAQPCLVHTARKVIEVPEALEFNPVREVNLKTLSHWTILRGVHFMFWCSISGASHGWLFEQEKFLSHRPFSFSPYSLSHHCPKRSTCRCLIHRIYRYILKCCSTFFPQPQFYFQHMYPRELILWFPGAPPSVLPMSSLFDVVAAMTTGSWNMILAFLNKDIISGAKQLLWTGRVSDVQRRNKNISCAIRWLRFLNSITQKHMTFHLVK